MEATDNAFWDQFWADTATSVQDVFALVPAAEIRAVREESPSNLATLCYKVWVVGLLTAAPIVPREAERPSPIHRSSGPVSLPPVLLGGAKGKVTNPGSRHL